MNKFLFLICQFGVLLPLGAQNDILSGLFGKEEPQFNVSVEPSGEEGVIELTFYYTHSKVDQLEVSFWLTDLGTNFISSGENDMVKGLSNIGNRKEEIIQISNLKKNHFYSIGIDYRSPKGLSRKFASKVILDGYHYKGLQQSNAHVPTPAVSEQTTVKENNRVQTDFNQPCFDPRFSIRVETTGYCTGFNKPAILIQCENCQGKEWTFSVETRDAYSNWTPVRADGKRQQASGIALRTEALCTLRPGNYEVQVLAWGKNCSTPIVETLGTTIAIGGRSASPSGQSSNSITKREEVNIQSIPDSCYINYEALLDGSSIKGILELPFNSPCVDFKPYVKVRYVHPGHRDITTDEILLLPGGRIPFSIDLDQQDLARSIHTLQAVVYLGEGNGVADIPVNTFWMKANDAYGYTESPYTEPTNPGIVEEEELEERGTDDEFESSILEENIDDVSVTAFDPNCTQIQDLQLVYGSGRSKTPLFISWMSPRCCQEDGCDYSVWAGPAIDQLRLLVKGNKPGAVVKELMQNARASDTYYEVVVSTNNRKRKAAYVPGEGPIYGIEPISAYHDKINPPKEVVIKVDAYETYKTPTLGINEFRSCRIFRPTTLSTDNSVSPGTAVNFSYKFAEKGYKYSLYFKPASSEQWYIAPDTKELNDRASFDFTAEEKHNGKYVILAYNASINWGCLSLPVSEAIDLKVTKP